MRLLHTSDWHLGQHFMGKTREAEHRAFLAWLLEQVREREVDAVLVAGDVFDTGAPPSYARELYNHFIVELRQAGAELVILGGNHDSVATLGESRTLLAGDYYPRLHLSWVNPWDDQVTAGGILWAGGEMVSVTMLGILVLQWIRQSER